VARARQIIPADERTFRTSESSGELPFDASRRTALDQGAGHRAGAASASLYDVELSDIGTFPMPGAEP